MIDPVVFAARFDALLAVNGVAAGARRAEAFARVLGMYPPRDGRELYRLARLAMLPGIQALGPFDAAFAALVASASGAPSSPLPSLVKTDAPSRPLSGRAERRAPPSDVPAGEDAAREASAELAMASDAERFRARDFAEMDDAERAAALRLIARLRVPRETRPSRRRRPSAHGERLDWSGTFRVAVRTAGEVVRLRRTRAREHLRPIVFLCDVSGSMSPYARAMLTYARTVALARPRVAAFAFATRLTDLTARLRATRGLGALARAIPDLDGGTRIGEALAFFNARYAQRGAARGGTVVIVSDGWEREDPARVGREMSRLRRLARRIVWVNPRKSHPAYAPLAGGMAAALPYVDELVAGADVRSLEALAATLSR